MTAVVLIRRILPLTCLLPLLSHGQVDTETNYDPRDLSGIWDDFPNRSPRRNWRSSYSIRSDFRGNSARSIQTWGSRTGRKVTIPTLATRIAEDFNWQKKRASSILGINASTLYRKIQRYGLESGRRRETVEQD